MGKALKDGRERVGTLNTLRELGRPFAAGNQPETYVRLGEDCWPSALAGKLPRLSLSPILSVCASSCPHVAVAWKLSPESQFELSSGTSSPAGHWSRRYHSQSILCDRDIHAGTTSYLLSPEMVIQWLEWMGRGDKEGKGRSSKHKEASGIGQVQLL